MSDDKSSIIIVSVFLQNESFLEVQEIVLIEPISSYVLFFIRQPRQFIRWYEVGSSWFTVSFTSPSPKLL